MSYEFFIAAALLALFGASALHNQGPHAALQIGLAVMMSGGGWYVRAGTREGRVIGLYAAAVTVAVGAYVVVFENGYIVGTIIAVFTLFRLWSAGAPVMQQVAPALPTQPMLAFDAPGAYGEGAVPPQQRAAPEPAPFYPAPEQAPYYASPERLPGDPA